jgi:hypothetical protein
MNVYFPVQIKPGADIKVVAAEVSRISRVFVVGIVFNFNGLEIKVEPHMSAQDVLVAYYHDYYSRAAKVN